MPSFFDKFTKNAKKALMAATQEAKNLGHNYIGTEHLLLGIVKEEGMAGDILRQMGLTDEMVTRSILHLIGKGNYQFSDAFGYTPRTKKVLEQSYAEAKRLDRNYVGTEHILLALFKEREGVAPMCSRSWARTRRPCTPSCKASCPSWQPGRRRGAQGGGRGERPNPHVG